MQISEAVYRALMGSQGDLGIVADWIGDNFPGHPEADTYCRRLRDPKNVRIQTVIDAIAKFGTRKERREICRIQRLVLRCRKCTIPHHPRWPDGITGLQNRKWLNHILGNVIPTEKRGDDQRYWCDHKRTVLANFRKRRLFLCDPTVQNGWAYLQLLRQLMSIILSSSKAAADLRAAPRSSSLPDVT